MDWMILPLKRYVEFTGRSRRQEFWMWTLFVILVSMALSVVDALLGLGGRATSVSTTAPGSAGVYAGLSGGWLANIFTIAVLLPNLAVSVRRLHDLNRSGWWLLLLVVPYAIGFVSLAGGAAAASMPVMALGGVAMLVGLIGAIVLLVWYCTAGTVGPNRFGEDPKADIPADLARTFE